MEGILELQSRATVFIALGALFAMMGGFVLYASFDNPELEKAEIRLGEVVLMDVDTIENRATLQVSFVVKNPSEKTFTVPSIVYELYADGTSLGSGQYSTEDIAMPGRAAFYQGTEIPLKSLFYMTRNAENANSYDDIIGGGVPDYTADGMMVVETAWSLIEKEFESR